MTDRSKKIKLVMKLIVSHCFARIVNQWQAGGTIVKAEIQPPSLKEKQRKEREALILEAAESFFSEKGYHNVSMEEIAANVGIAKGTVYLHFPSKEALCVALYIRDMQQLLADFPQVIAHKPTVRAKLEALLTLIYTGVHRKRTRTLSTISSSGDVRKLFSESSEMQATWRQLTDNVQALLDEGKASGEITTKIPTRIMMVSFFNTLSPLTSDRVRLEDEYTLPEIIHYMGEIFFQGIMKN
jgi:AcrR family transcriptional regulator